MTSRLTLQCGVTSIPAKHSAVFIRPQHDWCWGHVGTVLYVLEWSSCADKDFCPVNVASVLRHHRILLWVCLNFMVFHSKIKLLCCDLMKDRHNTNTEIIDIGLISLIRFDFTSEIVSHSYATIG